MKPDNLRKRERLFNEAVKKAEERRKKGFFEGAALAYMEATKLLPEDNYPEQIASCLNDAGFSYGLANKNALAENCVLRAITLWEKTSGIEHFNAATALNNLGNLYHSKGDIYKAEDYYKKSLNICEKILEMNDPLKVALLTNLGNLYAENNELNKSKPFLQQIEYLQKKPLTKDFQINNALACGQERLQVQIEKLESENREIQAALYQSKKLEHLGQMATMMAHNMNQPIGVIRMATSGALSDINENLFDPETELKPLLEKILNQTERLNLIMDNFRSFSRGDRTVLSAVNLKNIIEDIYQLLFVAQYQLDRIELQKDFIVSPIAHANEFAIQEMLISLLSNAREAVKDKPIKQIKIITWQENNQVGFCVEDNGDGIKEEDSPKLFTPFLSSKNEGMGLGLYFCREIAKDLGGSIEYYPASLGGAGFKITLPIQQDNK